MKVFDSQKKYNTRINLHVHIIERVYTKVNTRSL